MSRTLIFVFYVAACACNAQVGSTSHFNVVSKTKELIEENYIIDEVARSLKDSLDPMKYESLTRPEFVSQFNKDLFRLSQDKHLRIEYNPAYSEKIVTSVDPNEEQRLNERKTNYGFERVEILPSNTGYLKLTYFAEPDGLTPLIQGVFTFVQHTNALIIDLRGNTGGSGNMLKTLVSGFIREEAHPFLKITYKDRTIELTPDSGPVFSYHNPVYLLCDSGTFSAGEAFAFILQNRKIAVVVGEKTAGAGNIAGPYRVDENFVLTIPVGVIVDPLTNKGWEQNGVTPDIVAGSEEALSETIKVISSGGKQK